MEWEARAGSIIVVLEIVVRCLVGVGMAVQNKVLDATREGLVARGFENT